MIEEENNGSDLVSSDDVESYKHLFQGEIDHIKRSVDKAILECWVCSEEETK